MIKDITRKTTTVFFYICQQGGVCHLVFCSLAFIAIVPFFLASEYTVLLSSHVFPKSVLFARVEGDWNKLGITVHKGRNSLAHRLQWLLKSVRFFSTFTRKMVLFTLENSTGRRATSLTRSKLEELGSIVRITLMNRAPDRFSVGLLRTH